MTKRRIAIFTGNRAEYGLLYPLIKKLNEREDVDFHLLVSGAHLDRNFGGTLSEIERDGFRISREIVINMSEDNLTATARAIGGGILSMVDALAQIRPDILVVYADRFEGFSAVIAGSQMGIPVAHIEGGDVTEGGALDDSVRHAMTKLSHLHFTTNAMASNRIKAMGEEPWRVHTVGFVDLDLIELGRLTKPADLVTRYKLDLSRPIVVFTQHSVALDAEQAAAQIRPSLAALEQLVPLGVQIFVTYPNNDAGGRAILAEIEDWKRRGLPGEIQIHPSLGQPNYHGLLALAGNPAHRVVCVGNSSSGIKETPAFRCPAVNIGSRQDGRLRAQNVIDTAYDTGEILEAMKTSLFDDAFRERCRNVENPYGSGNVGQKITDVLMSVDLGPALLRKKTSSRGEERDGWYR
jgi:UDP-N-acetylglucosamine 2-epimerase (non-hydrolysing)/GDP/UDP-N,N'-diacetylbacillosamine 2-epimerase (hydrolysing)